MIRRSYPFSRDNAGERDTDAGCSVQPRWGSFASQLFAEVTSEMIAIVGEKVVRRSQEILRGIFDYLLDFMLGAECEALQ